LKSSHLEKEEAIILEVHLPKKIAMPQVALFPAAFSKISNSTSSIKIAI
jgi:hypothetical protein